MTARRRLAKWAALAAAGVAWVCEGRDGVTVRVLPRPLATNAEPFRIGLQMGFPERGAACPLRAVFLETETVRADTHCTAEAVARSEAGEPVWRVTNAGTVPGGFAVDTRPLRGGAVHALRWRCRFLKGGGGLRVRCAESVRRPVPQRGRKERAAFVEDEVEVARKSFPSRGAEWREGCLTVRPPADGAVRCEFRLAGGCVAEFAGLAVAPEDSAEGWDGQALEALRLAGAARVRWPAGAGADAYDWYQGVGELPARRTSAGREFGTAEFVRFCRLLQAEPVLRVTVLPGDAGLAGPPDGVAGEGAARAAEWVAYCNAPTHDALARLRQRHGCPEPLGVGRWSLAFPEGVTAAPAPLAERGRAYEDAMRAADRSIRVGPAGADVVLRERRDACVAELMRRFEREGAGPEGDSCRAWYRALALLNDALQHLRAGRGPVWSPDLAEQLVNRSLYARHKLTAWGNVLALVNRFPARVPLATEGLPGGPQGSLQAVAAWTEDDTALVLFLYNSGPETRLLRLDLTALERGFLFWTAEQLAADFAGREKESALPLQRRLKAGSALPQVILYEVAPASATRLVVKR